MPWVAIHQRDQLKKATSKGPPPMRIRSAEPTWNVTLLVPSELAARRASAILAGSGSMATTFEARGANCRVSLPSPHPTSRTLRPFKLTKRWISRSSIPGGG